MIIVISPENAVENEGALVNALLANGLDLFHIRKYNFDDEEMKTYLNAISEGMREHLVLHSHYHLAAQFGIERLHVRESERLNKSYRGYEKYKLSTSVHHIDNFNELGELWKYAFLSPFFPSISKAGYTSNERIMKNLERRKNTKVGLIALGGIRPENARKVVEHGADGIALLGSIWHSCRPLNIFLQCRKAVL